MKNYLILLFIFSVPSLGCASGPIKYFKEGNYQLIDGLEEQCGSGPFQYYDNKTRVQIGDHGFFIQDSSGVEDSKDLKGRSCKEKYSESLENVDSKRASILKATLKITCGNKVVSDLFESMTLSYDPNLEEYKAFYEKTEYVKNAGDSYRCEWRKRK
ncbi:MAG: hypothetical protein KDD33_04075 [Bdellovibrionales bacterium]|nr:hypothetical protein [Bdellovibrionales bacterium]